MLSDEQLLDRAYIHVPRGWPKTITEQDFERSKAEYLQRMRQEINRFTLATRKVITDDLCEPVPDSAWTDKIHDGVIHGSFGSFGSFKNPASK